ncbi:MAG: catalase [Actinomycetota bacterium]
METATTNRPTGPELVQWVRNDFPGFTPGTRAAHTVGIGVSGTFTPSNAIARYCVAEHFNDGPHQVIARFSNGSGLDTERDLHTDARGLAVKFFRGQERETDLVSMTLPVFFVRNGADFDGFSKVSVPVPVDELRLSWWQRFKLDLQLRKPPAPPPDDVQRAIDPEHLTAYSKDHPEAKTAVGALAGLITPVSYARATYHGVHTFVMTGPDGREHAVRYHWEPFLGVRGVTPAERKVLPNDYLHHDLRRRLHDGTINFVLNVAIGEAGDRFDDPTHIWQVQRRRIVAGILTLDHVFADQEDDCERVSYNPGRLISGFGPSGDELLQARRRAYEASCTERKGQGCPIFGPTIDLRDRVDVTDGDVPASADVD